MAPSKYGKTIGVVWLILALNFFSHPLLSQQYVADYTVAKEDVLRKIPQEYIDKARRELVIAYQHTSHGTHVSRGVFGLPDYKPGDSLLFAISLSPAADSLEFRDYALEDYAPPGVSAVDLSVDETAFIQTSRNYLDAPENASVNVVMWSWCDINGHDAAGNYLPGMDSLIREYGPGGTKIGNGPGQRENPVTFIFMTGHANEDANTGYPTRPKEQADTITGYCRSIQQYCLDYYSIDTRDMEDNYWEDAGDNGNSGSYGGNFYQDWQDAQLLGEGYFESKMAPGGTIAYGDHNTQYITSNRKAYAFWWILARISGWDGDTTATCVLNFSPDNQWIGSEAPVEAGVSEWDSSVVYMEFQYSTDTMSWHPLPTAGSLHGRDSSGTDGWSLTFLTENTPVHGTINDPSVWIRARAAYGSGFVTAWDVSDIFGIDNTPPAFSSRDQTSPLLPGPVSLLQTISDSLSGVLDDEIHPRFLIGRSTFFLPDSVWQDSLWQDTLRLEIDCYDTIPGSWNGTAYQAMFDVHDSLAGDTIYWRVLALDRVGNSSLSEVHPAGMVQDPDTTGPVFSDFLDDGDQQSGTYHFSVRITDQDSVVDNQDYPRLYYRFNTPAIDSAAFDGYTSMGQNPDSIFSAEVDIGTEHTGDYLYWRVFAFNAANPPDTSWSSLQNGGRIVNTPPTDLFLDPDSIAENSPIGTRIGSLHTLDEDDTLHVYELVEGEGDLHNLFFEIDSAGVLRSTVSLDFEAMDSCSIRVRTTDMAGNELEKILQIRIMNVNEAPVASGLSLLPSPAGAESDLVLSYSYSDPENDPELGTQIRWYRDSIHQPLLDDTLVVSHVHTNPGDTWFATVQPSDSLLQGALAASPALLISGDPLCFDETLVAASGVLSDNSGEENYLNDADCRKLIQPPHADYITLSFTELHTEDGYDFVRVYDGPTTSDPLLGEYTGIGQLPVLTSTGGSMLVHFTSDYSITTEGWSAVYTSGSTEPICVNETFTEPSGTVTDNSLDDDYMNLADCQKLIQPAGADQIVLTFLEFDLEQGNDTLRIHDGESTSDPVLAEFTGTDLPGEIVSGGGSLLIHFTSNDSITAAGWTAVYSSNAPDCGPCLEETFTQASGLLSDNSCGEDYLNDTDCRKLIQPGGADYITLTFTEFRTEANYDFVYVYDGPDTSDPLLGTFTGTSLPEALTSSGGSMLVQFVSDYSITEAGWNAEYTSGEILPVCVNETFTAAAGVVDDNSGMDDYMNLADCQKLIQVAGADSITLVFTQFSLEDGQDFVHVYDGPAISDPLLGSYTGTVLPDTIVSSGESLLIHFTSNDSITASGWAAVYTSNAPVCGPCLDETFTASSGTLSDNSCDANYLNDMDCRKLIQPAEADYVVLNFTGFQLESGYDFVRVYDGSSTSAPLLGEFTGSSLPGSLMSSGGSMLIHFTSDYSITAGGWMASYNSGTIEPVCMDETFTSWSGTVDDNSGSENYMNDASCRKLIQPLGADSISLVFTAFELENGNDQVWVYDGAGTNDPLLGVFTGDILPDTLTSRTGSMLLVFTSNESITASGWSAEYTAQGAGICGPCMDETYTDPTGVLSDNSCELDYQNDSDCRKLIQPPGATNISLSFSSFFLESGYDFVRVYDGSTTSDPLLGEFTGNSVPGILTSSGGSMLVHFTSDYSVTGPGWEASYEINTSGCGPCANEVLVESSGVISDNSCDGNYGNDADCQKLIEPVGAEYVELTFTEFSLESGYDFVRVYDGSSPDDPILGEFTGNDLPGTLTSSGGSMLVHFISDYSVTAAGWSAAYVSGPSRNTILGGRDLAGPAADLLLFPNPTDGKFHIGLEQEVEKELILLITDASGKILVQRMVAADGKLWREELDFSEMPAGIYFIQLYNTSFRKSGKIVVY